VHDEDGAVGADELDAGGEAGDERDGGGEDAGGELGGVVLGAGWVEGGGVKVCVGTGVGTLPFGAISCLVAIGRFGLPLR
jgi:hypothetical protein